MSVSRFRNDKGCQFLHKNLRTTVYDGLSTATSASKLIISNKVNRIELDLAESPSSSRKNGFIVNLLCSPCGESTVVSIVSCRCVYCCPVLGGKKFDNIHFVFVMALCYVQKCKLSYHVLGMTQNCIPPSEIIIPNRECVIRLGIGEGANVIFKQVSHTSR